MRGSFERDKHYPWSVQMIGEQYVPQNLQTNEKLPGHATFSAAYEAMEVHLDKVKAGTAEASASVAR